MLLWKETLVGQLGQDEHPAVSKQCSALKKDAITESVLLHLERSLLYYTYTIGSFHFPKPRFVSRGAAEGNKYGQGDWLLPVSEITKLDQCLSVI